jgi:hypothetical protein
MSLTCQDSEIDVLSIICSNIVGEGWEPCVQQLTFAQSVLLSNEHLDPGHVLDQTAIQRLCDSRGHNSLIFKPAEVWNPWTWEWDFTGPAFAKTSCYLVHDNYIFSASIDSQIHIYAFASLSNCFCGHPRKVVHMGRLFSSLPHSQAMCFFEDKLITACSYGIEVWEMRGFFDFPLTSSYVIPFPQKDLAPISIHADLCGISVVARNRRETLLFEISFHGL